MIALVIDVGSSSVRAMLFDESLHALPDAAATRKHSFKSDAPGESTTDVEMLRHLVEACIDEILTHPAAGQISVVGMTSFVGSLVGVDAQGRPLMPMLTYMDSQCAADLAPLASQVDLGAIHQRTGCVHHTAYHPARLRWLKNTRPETVAQAVRWLDVATYLYVHWFGDSPCSLSTAAWTGLLNRTTNTWDTEWLDLLEISHTMLPEVVEYSETLAGLRPDYAARWPQLARVPFCLAVGDGATANLGSGAIDSSALALTIGTTTAMRIVTHGAPPPVPLGLWSYPIDQGRHLTGGAMSEGGNIPEWARSILKLPTHDEVERMLLERTPDSHGLTFVPLLAGERSPGWLPYATGWIKGLRITTSPLDILQAALEGVALRLSLLASMLGHADARIMAGGGALAHSPAWAQIVANALGRNLYLLSETEVSARGTALLAFEAISEFDARAHPPDVAHVVMFDPAAYEVLAGARERLAAFYQQQRESMVL